MSAKRDPTLAEGRAWSGRAREMLDLLLVGVTISYLFGFLVWSGWALANNLGLMPLVNAQYLAAGLIPAGLVSGTLLASRPLVSISERMAQWWEAIGSKPVKYLTVAIAILVFTAGLWVATHVFGALTLTGSLILLFPMLLLAGIFKRKANLTVSKFHKGVCALVWRFFFGVPIGIVLLLMVMYSAVAFYLKFPQEMGGVRPRCAYVDVEAKELASETLEAITSRQLTATPGEVVRSGELVVYLATSESLLVRPRNHQSERMVIELRRDLVTAITWCG